MATTRVVEQRVGRAIGRGGWGVNRITRDLRKAGMLPAGLPGGGKGAAHWGVEPHTTFAIALGASDASTEAADCVRTYGELVPEFRTYSRDHVIAGATVTEHSMTYLRGSLLSNSGEIDPERLLIPGRTLRETIECVLAAGAKSPEVCSALERQEFAVSFSRHEPGAWVELRQKDGRRSQFYGPKMLVHAPLARADKDTFSIPITAKLPTAFFLLLIELLKDSLKHQRDMLPLPPLGSSVPADTPETKNAGGVPAPPAPTRDNLSGDDTEKGDLHTPEASPSLSHGQAVSRPDYPPTGGASGYDCQARSAFAAAA